MSSFCYYTTAAVGGGGDGGVERQCVPTMVMLFHLTELVAGRMCGSDWIEIHACGKEWNKRIEQIRAHCTWNKHTLTDEQKKIGWTKHINFCLTQRNGCWFRAPFSIDALRCRFSFFLSNYSIFSPNRNYNHSNVALCLKILLPNVRINTCNTYILELPSELCVEISSKVHRRDSSHFKNSRTNCALNGMAFLPQTYVKKAASDVWVYNFPGGQVDDFVRRKNVWSVKTLSTKPFAKFTNSAPKT